MEIIYNLVLIIKNKYIIQNNYIINEYYQSSNLATSIGFLIPNDQYLDFYYFKHNIMKWPIKDIYDNVDNLM